jgi:uncharacterized protein YukE
MRLISTRTGSSLRRGRVLVLAALLVTASSAFAALGYASPTAALQAPGNTQPPTISGAPHPGQRLTAEPGTWTGTAPIRFQYFWLRCNRNGNNCSRISGETGTRYTARNADVGRTLRVLVRARNAQGTTDARSAAVAIVAASAPRNTARPTITGTAQEGQTLTAGQGTWSGTTPMAFAFQWRRCNAAGSSCSSITGGTAQTYAVTAQDVGHTLRVRVTARNIAGSRTADSARTPQIAAPGPGGQVPLPGNLVSIPITAVGLPERLIVSGVEFSPNPVTSRAQPIRVRFRVTDTRGFVVRDALVFVRSTPLVTSTPPERPTGTDGWVEFTVQPTAGFPLGGTSVQFFVRARKAGEPMLAGVSSRRLVQVRTR